MGGAWRLLFWRWSGDMKVLAALTLAHLRPLGQPVTFWGSISGPWPALPKWDTKGKCTQKIYTRGTLSPFHPPLVFLLSQSLSCLYWLPAGLENTSPARRGTAHRV